MSELINKFVKDFGTTLESWEFWQKEHGVNPRILIAGPSRIIGLVDLEALEEDIDWETYTKCSEPTKKMTGNFVYGGRMYSIYFLRDMYNWLPEVVDVTIYHETIMFKLTDSVAIGLGTKVQVDDWYYNDEGVMFVEFDWTETKDEWKTTTTDKEFVKWIDCVAKRKHHGKSHVWYEEVYRFEKFFQVEEEMGDFLDI